jgi:hypothetical protein
MLHQVAGLGWLGLAIIGKLVDVLEVEAAELWLPPKKGTRDR